jgi:polysaccharide deacetylase 2 family uncharacterized protein YibQ
MAGAFLAGLLVVGVALLLPGQGNREQGPVSPLSPVPQATAPQPLPAEPPPALPRLAIVVDDLGYEPSRDAEWMKFPEKITVAVIPFGPSSRKVAESARARGWGVILHVPMEPENPAPDRTEGFRLRRGMTGDEMESLLARMIEDIPQAAGASNHMGSAFTADPEAMAAYVAVLGKKGLYLLDSVTTPGSVALETALRAGVPAARRDVFLDAGMNPGEMRLQWARAIAIAKEKGAAVLICHGRAETLKTILDLLPDLRKEKVQAVPLEELLQGKGV